MTLPLQLQAQRHAQLGSPRTRRRFSTSPHITADWLRATFRLAFRGDSPAASQRRCCSANGLSPCSIALCRRAHHRRLEPMVAGQLHAQVLPAVPGSATPQPDPPGTSTATAWLLNRPRRVHVRHERAGSDQRNPGQGHQPRDQLLATRQTRQPPTHRRLLAHRLVVALHRISNCSRTTFIADASPTPPATPLASASRQSRPSVTTTPHPLQSAR